MFRIDSAVEEPIRRWPWWAARIANLLIRWTTEVCAGGCGYPITGRFSYELEVIGQTRVVFGICSVGGRCQQVVANDPRDEYGASYADFRPGIVAAIKNHPTTDVIRMTYSL